MSVTREYAIAAISKYGSMNKASKALHICDKTLRKAIKGKVGMGIKSIAMRETECINETNRLGISEQDLLEKTDIETRVLNAIKIEITHLSDKQYLRDSDMKKECRCPDTRLWRKLRETKDFHQNVMMVGMNREPMIYWGTSESIKSMINRGKAKVPNWIESSEET